MFKLFKKLIKYKKIIPFIIILIAAQAVLSLLLPDYMSKIISEGIKSPAYETAEDGQYIKSLINPKELDANVLQPISAMFAVKKYPRKNGSEVVTDERGFAVLADEDGQPLIGDAEYIKQNICYEKDESGKYILDADTGEKIIKYARQDSNGIVNDYIAADGLKVSSTGYETAGGNPVLGAVVSNVLIYDFERQPAKLVIDEYGYAEFIGFYKDDGGGNTMLKMGDYQIPALKFMREEYDFGKLRIDENGFATLKQVSYLNVILKYGLIMLGITFLISGFAVTANYLSSIVSMSFGRDIRDDLYRKINKFSAHDISRFGTASLITRTTNDVIQVQTLTYMIFRMVVMTPIMFIGGTIMALSKSAQMTLVLVFTIPLILLLVLLVGGRVVKLFKSMQKKIDNLTLIARENLSGVRVIRAFNKESYEDVRFDKANADVTRTAIKANRIMSFMFPAISLLMSLTTLAIIVIAVLTIKNNIMGSSYSQFADMMAVSQYIVLTMTSLLMAIMLFVMFPRASASAARINEVLETQIKISSPQNVVSPKPEIKGKIKFDNVNFKFEGSEASILSDINIDIDGGETISIIGSTGSGKSTLIGLIPRLFDATGGSVTVDGVDVKDYDLNVLRQKISFVPQKSLLFSGTIADNLKWGAPEADNEKMLKALEIAQIKDFVPGLPQGLDSEVDQGGVNFSGGQRQRLSIARAIIKDAEIYIFDDSFSALDFKTDYNLRNALKQNLSDKTIIIVSQRISTVMGSDKIIVLDEGRIAGMGKHDDLYDGCEVYREIALSQLSKEELNSYGR